MKRKTHSFFRKMISCFGLSLLVTAVVCGCGNQEEEGNANTLTIFNYGDYIDKDTIKMFEQETGIDVKYEEYLAPEDMYTKYKSGAINYDLICTSDYMVEKMILEGEAQPIDTSDMKYFDNIDPKYLEYCKAFDAENEYAVPYFWGTVGILYNETVVEEEVDSWSILWNQKYKDQIVMQNSMRDAFLVPLKWKGYSTNTTDKTQLLGAQELLIQQKPIVEAYLVDEIRDVMIAGDAAISVTYSGDATEAMDANEDLNYVVPKEGSNIWFDCWMIPKTARHKKEAEQFIDFMNREDVGMMNFDYIYYGTPNQAVFDELDEETQEDQATFPKDEVMEKCEVYQYLGAEMDQYYTKLWKELKAY